MARAEILNRAPRNAEVFTALAMWERFSVERREALRPCMFLIAEQQYTWGYALLTVVMNAEYFERIGPDSAWAAGSRTVEEYDLETQSTESPPCRWNIEGGTCDCSGWRTEGGRPVRGGTAIEYCGRCDHHVSWH